MTRRSFFSIALPALLLAPLGGGCAILYDRLGEKYSMTLSGGRVIPGPGDRQGSGIADILVDIGMPQLCFMLEVDDIAPATTATVHRGRSGEAGPPVATLEPPTDGESRACVLIERDLARAIIADPGAYHVLIRNADYPDGALRGQFEPHFLPD